MMETFGKEITRDTTERNHRFLEESLELVQSMGCTAAEAHMLVNYVYERAIGAPEQETGGVFVTLAALCNAAGIDVTECGERELARCWLNIERIRVKQAGKPCHSPLPGPSSIETTTSLPATRSVLGETTSTVGVRALPGPEAGLPSSVLLVESYPGEIRDLLQNAETSNRTGFTLPHSWRVRVRALLDRRPTAAGENAPHGTEAQCEFTP
jgi:hypothetical protein